MLNNIAERQDEIAAQLHDTDHRLGRIERRLIDLEKSGMALLSGIQQLKALCQQIQAQLTSGMTPDDVAAATAQIQGNIDKLDKTGSPAK